MVYNQNINKLIVFFFFLANNHTAFVLNPNPTISICVFCIGLPGFYLSNVFTNVLSIVLILSRPYPAPSQTSNFEQFAPSKFSQAT